MKTLFFSAVLVLSTVFTGSVLAHDIHNVVSDHYHPGPVYTHSVSSAYDHNRAHDYNSSYTNKHHYNRSQHLPKVTTNTATYYTRSYPVKKSYTYLTTPNTTIHHPPYAYSSCANRCDQSVPQRITVSSTLGGHNITYRAPSEYSAQENIIPTPSRHYRAYLEPRTTTHVSPYQTHKLTTTTCYNCY